MPIAKNGAVEINYETIGEAGAPTVLLINGLGSQMTRWPEAFCALLTAKGYRAVRFDNRDTGKSTWFKPGETYSLSDMAADGMAVLDAIGVKAAHVVGVSMGGMIAQQFAINFPELTLSLTSIMSTPAPLDVGTSTPECLAMLTRPRSEDLETFLVEEIENWQLTNGSAHPLDEAWVREQAITAMNRGRNPIGVLRHLCAVVGSPDRRPALSKLTVPVLVLHGDEDPLVTPSGGEATAAAIPHAKHVVYPGMGHSLPEPVWGVVAAEIVAVADLA